MLTRREQKGLNDFKFRTFIGCFPRDSERVKLRPVSDQAALRLGSRDSSVVECRTCDRKVSC